MIRIRAQNGRRARAPKIRHNRAVDASPPADEQTFREPRFPFAAGQGRVAVALVRHDPAGPRPAGDGRLETVAEAHIDFFVALAEDADFARGADRNARHARAFRLPLDWMREGRHDALETEPHRAHYLDLPGRSELSLGRGVVTPVAAGTGDAVVDADGTLTVRWRASRCATTPAEEHGSAGPEIPVTSAIRPGTDRPETPRTGGAASRDPSLMPAHETAPGLPPETTLEMRFEPTARPHFQLAVAGPASPARRGEVSKAAPARGEQAAP